MRRTKAFAVVLAGVFVASTAVAQTSNPGPGSSPGTQVPELHNLRSPGRPAHGQCPVHPSRPARSVSAINRGCRVRPARRHLADP